MKFLILCFGMMGIALGMPEPSSGVVIKISQIIGGSGAAGGNDAAGGGGGESGGSGAAGGNDVAGGGSGAAGGSGTAGGSSAIEGEASTTEESTTESSTTEESTTVASTTETPTTEASTTEGEKIILPTKAKGKMNWSDSIKYCEDMNAQPFIPRTSEDFELYTSVSKELGNYVWLPANDIAQEGTLKWWNEEDAPSSDPGLVWAKGEYMRYNTWSELRDCVNYFGGQDGAFMEDCNKLYFPMICQM